MLQFELIIPAYNEAASLPLLIEKTVTAATESKLSEQDFQLVIVQNGSSDNSDQILENLKATHLGPWFRVLRIDKNQGYGDGLFRGLQSTTAPVVGFMHADLQCDAIEAFRAFDLLVNKGAHKILVKGFRCDRALSNVLFSRAFEFVAWMLLKVRVKEINAQPKVFPRELLYQLTAPPKNIAFDLYLLLKARQARYTFETIPVHCPPRLYGESHWANGFRSRYRTISNIMRSMLQIRRQEGTL